MPPHETDFLVPPPSYRSINGDNGDSRFVKWLKSPYTIILFLVLISYATINEWTHNTQDAHSSFTTFFRWRIESWQLLRSTEKFISPDFYVKAEKRNYNCGLWMIPGSIEIDDTVGITLICNLEGTPNVFLDPVPVEVTINAVEENGTMGKMAVVRVSTPVFAERVFKVVWKWVETDLGVKVNEIDALNVDVKFLTST